MRKQIYLFMALLVLWGTSPAKAQTSDTQDRDEIVTSVRSYVAAFNQRDAAAVADHWSETGEMVESNGNLLVGRRAIQGSFESLFQELEDDQILTVRIERISFVTDDVAIEEGTANVSGGWTTQYAATHKKEGGRWVVHSVRESSISNGSAHYTHLQPLEWMIGDWIDQSDDATVEVSCNWSKNRNFITRNFKVSVPGMEPLEGTQIIGYNAATGNLQSWIFDSDGGSGSGAWVREGDSWVVDSSQTLADGRLATSVNRFTPIDSNQFRWESTNRIVDGESIPDSGAVTVVRVQNQPEE